MNDDRFTKQGTKHSTTTTGLDRPCERTDTGVTDWGECEPYLMTKL